jgi:hypothetical protein
MIAAALVFQPIAAVVLAMRSIVAESTIKFDEGAG